MIAKPQAVPVTAIRNPTTQPRKETPPPSLCQEGANPRLVFDLPIQRTPAQFRPIQTQSKRLGHVVVGKPVVSNK